MTPVAHGVSPHFERLVIEGPVAYEWGRFEATFQGARQRSRRPNPPPTHWLSTVT